MTKKQAFCCLNCKASANCCAECGECPTCCEDCGDTSSCTTTAYFKDGKFYKHYIVTYTSTWSWNYRTNIGRRRHSSNYSSSYNSATDTCTIAYYIDAAYSVDNNNFGSEIKSCSGSGKGLVIPNICYGCGADDADGNLHPCIKYPNNALWPVCTCYQKSNGQCFIPSVTDECQYFDKGCDNLLDCGVCDQETIDRNNCSGRYSKSFTAKIKFLNEVILYNNKGEFVDPSSIGASYNPCDPFELWNAPGCHFFHP